GTSDPGLAWRIRPETRGAHGCRSCGGARAEGDELHRHFSPHVSEKSNQWHEQKRKSGCPSASAKASAYSPWLSAPKTNTRSPAVTSSIWCAPVSVPSRAVRPAAQTSLVQTSSPDSW